MMTMNLKIGGERDNSGGSERDHGCLWFKVDEILRFF